MTFRLLFTDEARRNLEELERDKSLTKRLKAVRRTLGLLESNPRYPSLRTHKFHSLTGPRGEEIFEAYAEHQTPAAYRVFWYYGPAKSHITILAITPHP